MDPLRKKQCSLFQLTMPSVLMLAFLFVLTLPFPPRAFVYWRSKFLLGLNMYVSDRFIHEKKQLDEKSILLIYSDAYNDISIKKTSHKGSAYSISIQRAEYFKLA